MIVIAFAVAIAVAVAVAGASSHPAYLGRGCVRFCWYIISCGGGLRLLLLLRAWAYFLIDHDLPCLACAGVAMVAAIACFCLQLHLSVLVFTQLRALLPALRRRVRCVLDSVVYACICRSHLMSSSAPIPRVHVNSPLARACLLSSWSPSSWCFLSAPCADIAGALAHPVIAEGSVGCCSLSSTLFRTFFALPWHLRSSHSAYLGTRCVQFR